LAITSSDGKLRLLDGATMQPVMTVATDADGKVAFSPDGTRLAYAAEGGVVRLLALRVDDLIELARSRLHRSLTDEECRRYIHVDRCPSTSG
jgi:hypothetical protein